LELSFVIFFGLPSIRLSYFYDPNRRVWLAYLVYWIFCFFALFLNWLFFSNFIHLLLIYLELDISSFFICFLLTYYDIMIWLIYIASSLKLAQVSFFFPFLFFQFLFLFFLHLLGLNPSFVTFYVLVIVLFMRGCYLHPFKIKFIGVVWKNKKHIRYWSKNTLIDLRGCCLPPLEIKFISVVSPCWRKDRITKTLEY